MDSGNVNAAPAIRILIVDDHPAIRRGLAALLVPDGIVVCAEATRRTEAISEMQRVLPDVAIVDLSLDGEDGLALIAEMQRHDVPVLVYSMHDDARRVGGALAAGALGYVTKREFHDVLVQAIREVAAGRRFLSPQCAAVLAESVAGPQTEDPVGRLSSNERKVYELLGQGADIFDIAAALRITPNTVESYYSRILVKLGLSGMHELRRHAINHLRNQLP